MKSDEVPLEYRGIFEWIPNGSSVLDLGCGAGELLFLLVQKKNAKAQGIELNDQAIHQCVAKGLSVFHEDIDNGLAEYPDATFDFVILNQSFQQVKKPDWVLNEALRVGRKVIIGFPNFAYCKARWQIFFKGKVPVTTSLPYEWHDTPNLHFFSILDFIDYCRKRRFQIERSFFIGQNRRIKFLPNFFAQVGIFLISAKRHF
jgi:methionine biosynthesis protein MetW